MVWIQLLSLEMFENEIVDDEVPRQNVSRRLVFNRGFLALFALFNPEHRHEIVEQFHSFLVVQTTIFKQSHREFYVFSILQHQQSCLVFLLHPLKFEVGQSAL